MCTDCLAQSLYLLHIIIIIIVVLATVDISTAQLDQKLLGPWDHIPDFSCTPEVKQNAISTVMKAFSVSG